MWHGQSVLAATVVSLAIFAASTPAAAQQRQGGWFGVGGGWGTADVKCDDCTGGDRENSGVGYFNGGFTVNERVLIGAEFNLWTKQFADPDLGGTADVNLYNLFGTVTFYPDASKGFFVKAGGGGAWMDMDIKATGTSLTLDLGSGPGFIVGGGYDIPVGRFAVTVAANYWYGKTSDLKVNGQPVLSGVSHNVVGVTVGFKIP
jgi:hypothetical protein